MIVSVIGCPNSGPATKVLTLPISHQIRAESREPTGCVMSRLSTPGPGAPFARQGHRGPLPPRGSLLRRRLRSLGHHARAAALALAALAVLALAVPEQAEAQTVTTFISNSAQLDTTRGSDLIRATAFTTGSSSGGYGLSSVDLYVDSQSGTVTPLVEIYENSSGEPGTLHATLSNPATVTERSVNTFTATNTTLSANTTYWLITSNSATTLGTGFRVNVRANATANTGAATGWSIGTGRFKNNIGAASWTSSGNRVIFTMRGTGAASTNNAPTVANPIQDQTATVGTALNFAFPTNTFADTDAGDTLTYTATKSDDSALPLWLSFAAATRTFSGTPQAADVGTVSVKVTASDGNGGSVSDTFDIVVSTAANNAPAFATDTASRSFTESVGDDGIDPAVDVGAPVTATDADGDTLTYSLEGTDAASFSIVSSSGQIRTEHAFVFDREVKASYSVTVKADDSNGGTDTIAVTINVDNAVEKPRAPDMPTVTATSGSTTSLDVSWMAHFTRPNTGRPAITGYKVEYRAGVSGNWINHPHTGTGRTATIASLTAATSYQVHVLAVNSDGDGPFSSPGAGTTGTVTATAPMVNDVDVTSSPAMDDTYGTGEMIEFTVTFDQAVTVTGTPEFEFCLGSTATVSCSSGTPPPALRSAALLSGSGTTALVFSYTVLVGDVDDNGIYAGNQTIKLDGGDTIQGTVGGLDAVLTHDAVGTPTGHKVNGAAANTAPTAANNTVTTAEDRAYTFTAGDFGFMDADAGAALASVKIVTPPGEGTLALDGTAVLADAVVTKAQIDGDMLTFRPARDAHGDPYTTFTFKVNDGTDDSASAYTMTIDVTDAPAPVCTAPSFGDRRQIWTGTVTAEEFSFMGSVSGYGFDSTTGISSLLPSAEFSIGSNNYTIVALSVVNAGDLLFNLASTTPLTATERAALRLHVCDEDLDFSDALIAPNNPRYGWTATLDWSAPVVTRMVYLSLPANNVATGEPAITGTAQVGQELTAVTTGILDTDGLTDVDFTYQWLRVDADGTSDEEDISGEIAATYTLTDDDAGQKIKVKVSFTDNLDSTETLTSAAYPSSGTVGMATTSTAPFTAAWAADAYTADEGESVTVTATLHTAADEPKPSESYVIRVITEGNSATAGADYTPVTINLTVTPSVWEVDDAMFTATVAVTVETVEDSVLEGDERFYVILTGAIGEAQPGLECTDEFRNLGSASGCATVVTIADDETLSVTEVTVSSTPAAGETYLAGEAIEFTVGFTASVTVTGTPTFAFTLGSAVRQATYASGSETAALVFSYTVLAGDLDRDGISWEADALALAGGTIRLTTDDANIMVDATLAHAEEGPQTGHKVDGGAPTVPPDPTPPTLVLATATTLTIEWTHPGDGGSPLTRNFIEYRVEGTTVWTNWYRGDTPTTVTRTVIRNLAAATAYDVRVHSTNAIGNSQWVQSATAFSTLANNAATGAPSITGTAQVGQDLTASTTGIDDDDGLPSSFTYQWVRVDADGTSNPVDITDANAATYTLTDDDAGKKIKVKVSFTDNLDSTETLTSAAYPSSGTVTAAAGTNTAPTAADNTVTTGEDRAYTFEADDFGFVDTDSGDTLASVKIVTVPTPGTLALDGTAVLANAVVTKAQIDGNMLTFTPVAGASGAPYTTFTFKVNDGTDDSASAYTMTIDVTAAGTNTAPTAANNTVTTAEDTV